jgi:glucosamine-6-phosphate deaminase
MNEPGTPADRTTHRAELHASTVAASRRYLDHAQTPTWGATVGLKHLLGSKEIWLLACGANKAELVRRSVLGEVTTDVPASLLRSHPNSFLFVDAAAGAGL